MIVSIHVCGEGGCVVNYCMDNCGSVIVTTDVKPSQVIRMLYIVTWKCSFMSLMSRVEK